MPRSALSADTKRFAGTNAFSPEFAYVPGRYLQLPSKAPRRNISDEKGTTMDAEESTRVDVIGAHKVLFGSVEAVNALDIQTNRAEGASRRNEVILVYPWTVGGGATVTRGDLARLMPQCYLSDGVVTFGINWWMMKLASTRRQMVYVFNSFFFTKLRQGGFAEVRKWTRNVDIFQKAYLLIPVHERDHWFLIVISDPGLVLREQEADNLSSIIFTLDSLGFTHDDVVDILANYLRAEAADKLKVLCSRTARGRKVLMPMQTNNFDCGVYLIHFLGVFVSDMDYYGCIIRKAHQTSIDSRREWQMEEIEGLRGRLRAEILECAEDWRAWRTRAAPASGALKSEREDEVEIVESNVNGDVTYIM